MKIFFSWSGHLSKKVAMVFKPWLKTQIFPDADLDIFISEEDIQSGADWFQSIKNRLTDSNLAVIFLTPENVTAPWLNFEAGAIAMADGKPLAVFLIDVQPSEIKSPLKHYQATTVHKDSVRKLIGDIKKYGGLVSPADAHIDVIFETNYESLIKEIEKEKSSIARDYSSEFSIFPEHIRRIKKNKVFIGSPMASIKEDDYAEIRDDVLRLKRAIEEFCNFADVYYPGDEIKSRSEFDGQEKAIINDFRCLKESEHYVFVYPKRVPSSILMEIGYAIALSKKTIIFTNSRKSLPYMLQQADKAIPNIRIYEYKKFDEVISLIKGNGESLFTKGVFG